MDELVDDDVGLVEEVEEPLMSFGDLYPSPNWKDSSNEGSQTRHQYSISLMTDGVSSPDIPRLSVRGRSEVILQTNPMNSTRLAGSSLISRHVVEPSLPEPRGSELESPSTHSNSQPSTNNDDLSESSQNKDFHERDEDALSDLLTVTSSKSGRRTDLLAKKLSLQVQNLRQENDLLRQSMEQARVNDVALLRSKLRSTHADMVAFQQQNVDLKDRLRSLEAKLFEALSEKFDDSDTNSHGTPSLSEIIRDKLQRRIQQQEMATVLGTDADDAAAQRHSTNQLLDSKSSIRLTDGVKASFAALQNRCRHLETLTASYEKRIVLMQDEIESYRNAKSQSVAESNSSKTVSFGGTGRDAAAWDSPAPTDGQVPTEAMKRLRRSEAVRKLLEESRAEDQRTIHELAQEVRRLTALLPREVVDADENTVATTSTAPEDGVNPRITPQTEMSLAADTDPSHDSSSHDASAPSVPLIHEDSITVPQPTSKSKCSCLRNIAMAGLIALGVILSLLALIELVPAFLLSE